MSEFYVYLYFDPDTNLPFYVGKGQNYRSRKHLHQCHNAPMANKIRAMKERGVKPDIVVLPAESEQSAFDKEAELISHYGRRSEGGFLSNVLTGGERSMGFKGRRHSDETKAKISAAGRGRVVSAETRAAIGRGKKGKPINMSEEAKQKSGSPEYRVGSYQTDVSRKSSLRVESGTP